MTQPAVMSMMRVVLAGVLAGVLAVTLSAGCSNSSSLPSPASPPLEGSDDGSASRVQTNVVVGQHGPVAGAEIFAPGQPPLAITDAHGRFTLPALPKMLAVFKAGYRIERVDGHALPTTIQLVNLPEQDSSDYAWVDPTPDTSRPDSCGNCHKEAYREWSGGAHARSADNPRFLNLYDGTDAHGNQDRGWNLLADHPQGAGVCQSCHAPSTAPETLADDLRKLQGVGRQGVHCDYCHKIQDVVEDSQLGYAHGRYASRLLRPAEGQLIFGPRKDAAGPDNAFAAVQSDSRLCATCHEGTVFGVHVYSTWSEWRESPAGRDGVSCQDCHMRSHGKSTNTAPGHGGPERRPGSIASHDLMPGGQESMLRDCLTVEAKSRPPREDGGRRIEVTLVAEGVGHAVPTGFIDRHLLLIVRGVGPVGETVPALDGPRLDSAAGPRLAGRAGTLFAKRLTGLDGQSPAPFWRPVARVDDTRLRPGEPRTEAWTFPPEVVSVEIQLVYRPFWAEVARDKQWPQDEVVITRRTLEL